MKTIGNIIHNKTFPFKILDDKGNALYFETLDGSWRKSTYDDNSLRVYYINSEGFWSKREYDDRGFRTYYENSKGRIKDTRK